MMAKRGAVASYIVEQLIGCRTQLLSLGDLEPHERSALPERWRAVLDESGVISVPDVVQTWSSILPQRLPNFLGTFQSRGVGAYLSRVTRLADSSDTLALVYIWQLEKCSGDEFQFRVGYLPHDGNAATPYWDVLPPQLRKFYELLHDGFLTNTYIAGGLEPTIHMLPLDANPRSVVSILSSERPLLERSDIEYVAPLEDGGERHLNLDERPDITNLISICRNKSTARLMIDVSGSSDEAGAWEWWSDPSSGSVEFVPDLWAAIDDWLVQLFN